MRQMARQNEQRFCQRHEQRRDKCKRHHGDELTHHPRHEAEWQERDHRREHAGNNARDHFHGAVDCRRCEALTHPTVPVDVVAHHDGVVHHDPDRHEKREHRKHVERLVGSVHECPRAEHRKRNAHRHPEGNLEIEEEGEHDEHDHEPLHAVGDQHVETVPDVDRLVGPEREVVAGGQLRIDDVLLHRGNHREQVLARAAVDRHHHAGPAVDPVGGGHVGEFVADRTEVADGEHEAVRERDERQFRDLRSDIPLVLATEQDLATFAADRAAGEFQVFPADDVGHLLQ